MLEKNKFSMMLFLASEAAFFAVLILGYLYYYPSYASGPNSTNLNPLLTGIFTLALLASSFTLWQAQRSLDRDNPRGARLWLLATVALGAAFVGGQAWEYTNLLNENIRISNSLWGTTFYTLTGVHGLHVLSGLLILLILTGLAFSGYLTRNRRAAIANVELYWHFVDAVWIVIFAIVYVWPNL